MHEIFTTKKLHRFRVLELEQPPGVKTKGGEQWVDGSDSGTSLGAAEHPAVRRGSQESDAGRARDRSRLCPLPGGLTSSNSR